LQAVEQFHVKNYAKTVTANANIVDMGAFMSGGGTVIDTPVLAAA